MKKFKQINVEKQKNIINKTQSQFKFIENKPKDHFWKSMILIGVINVFLGLMNFEKYFLSEELTYDTALSHFRKNDHMNVALAARPYDQISDYFISKNNIDNGYQIIKDGKIVPPKKNFPTSLSYRKTIKIGYTDMSPDKGNYFLNYVKNILNKNYEFVFDQNNPDYLMFSFYGCNHNDPKFKDTIKIAIYEEGYIPSFIEEDYTFGLAHIFYLDRYFRRSTLIEFLQKMNLKNKDFREARQKALKGPMRTKFCGTLINNETNMNHFREKFMEELSKYKKVDNGGNLTNNIGYQVKDKIQFLNSYKFSMAFEKNTADGFSTDHILYALLAVTVPIYYGDYLIDEYINPNTYILVRNNVDLEEKIEYIKKIDQDDNLYRKFLMEDVLVDEDVVKKRKKDEKDYWSHIFRPDKYDAKRIDHVRFKTRKCMIKK
jgi:hypothetical protein